MTKRAENERQKRGPRTRHQATRAIGLMSAMPMVFFGIVFIYDILTISARLHFNVVRKLSERNDV